MVRCLHLAPLVTPLARKGQHTRSSFVAHNSSPQSCPHCGFLIPFGAPLCPHCRQPYLLDFPTIASPSGFGSQPPRPGILHRVRQMSGPRRRSIAFGIGSLVLICLFIIGTLLRPLRAKARARSLRCFHVSRRISGQAGSCVARLGLVGRRTLSSGIRDTARHRRPRIRALVC
jgi:hypothetical protein